MSRVVMEKESYSHYQVGTLLVEHLMHLHDDDDDRRRYPTRSALGSSIGRTA